MIVKELQLSFLFVFDLRIFIVLIIVAARPRGLPRRSLLWVDHGHTDEVQWLLSRIGIFAEQLACVERQLVLPKSCALCLRLSVACGCRLWFFCLRFESARDNHFSDKTRAGR